MKGIIWSFILFIWGSTLIVGLLFVSRYHYVYDVLANANKRCLKSTAQHILKVNYQVNLEEAFKFYLDNLSLGKLTNTKVELLGYNLNPLVLRVRLENRSIPFITILSDETVIEEVVDE